MPEQSTTQLAESLQLIEEVRNYLGRLPPHPMHRAMIGKIDDHLQKPFNVQTVETVKRTGIRWNQIITPSGVPILHAAIDLSDLELRIHIPFSPSSVGVSRQGLARQAAARLESEEGIFLSLNREWHY